MIQGAINQLIGMAAAGKKASDIAHAKEASAADKAAKAAAKEEAAKQKAMQRTRDKINAKYNQNKEYQEFVKSLNAPHAPDILKQIAFDASKRAPDVSIGGSRTAFSDYSPEAQAAFIRAAKGGKK